MTEELWLLVKRGLYYRPNDCGYTGIRDHAGRYTADEARARAGSEIKMVRLADAPEFSEACFDDLARAHLLKQRDAALMEIARLREHVDQLQAKMTCMCGDSVDHSPWAGHSPVSMFDYAVEQEVTRRAAITTSQRAEK